MDVYEIELLKGDLFLRWIVWHNGDQLATGIEYTRAMAVERAQHVIDRHTGFFGRLRSIVLAIAA